MAEPDDVLEAGGAFFGEADEEDTASSAPGFMYGFFQESIRDLGGGESPSEQPLLQGVTITAVPELRHRTRAVPVAAAAPQSPPPRRRPRFAFLTNWNERYELWRLDAGERWSNRLERCYRVRGRILGCVCLLLACVLGGALAMTAFFRDERAFIIDTSGMDYARHGHDGVNLTLPADALTCSELAAGMVARPGVREPALLAAVRATAETLMAKEPDLGCVCGPMFRSRRRYLVVRGGVGAPLQHLYNPVLDTAWDGALDDGRRLNVTDWLVLENQRMLFPDRADAVQVLRRSAVRLSYRDVKCAAAAIILQHELAFCAQAGLDLLDGRSVYDVAHTD